MIVLKEPDVDRTDAFDTNFRLVKRFQRSYQRIKAASLW